MPTFSVDRLPRHEDEQIVHHSVQRRRIQTAIARALGEAIVPGTLNLVARKPVRLRNATCRSFDKHLFWPCRVNGVPAWICRWPGCPLHVFEIASAVHLRSALGLTNGSPVWLEVPADHVDVVSRGQAVAWAAAWLWREDWYYRQRRHYSWYYHRIAKRLTRRCRARQ